MAHSRNTFRGGTLINCTVGGVKMPDMKHDDGPTAMSQYRVLGWAIGPFDFSFNCEWIPITQGDVIP